MGARMCMVMVWGLESGQIMDEILKRNPIGITKELNMSYDGNQE